MANEVGQGKGQEELAAEKRLKAFELRRDGFSYREIAKELDVCEATAHNYVHGILEKLHEQTLAHGMKYVEIELERLDRMLRPLLPKATEGDVQAQEMILKIQQRKSKYLGLDSPEKLEHSGSVSLLKLIGEAEDGKEKETPKT